ncbi:MAG: hypothetical protein GXP29_01350, partial [Planctomycetes bacterium]|nr:hypothetical protein [Planctomycetota bacterium]
MATSPTHNPLPKPTGQDSPGANAGSKTSPWVYRFLTLAVLAATVLLAHGWSLWDGLGIDDHWHYRTIRQTGWSPSELLDATTIRSADLFKLWWQDAPVQFQYSRPLSVALMKLVYTVTDGNVFAQHAVNLTLHLLAACLVTALCTKLTSHRFWSVAGGVLFVVYPLSVNAVGFLAAQNMVLQTVLLLGAILAYVRASQLNLNISATGVAASTPGLNHRWFALAVILWIGALFSRENAIVLPVVLLAMDVAFGGWKQAWRKKPAYLIMAVLGVAFLIWRLGFFYEPMPDVYVRRSS